MGASRVDRSRPSDHLPHDPPCPDGALGTRWVLYVLTVNARAEAGYELPAEEPEAEHAVYGSEGEFAAGDYGVDADYEVVHL